MPELSETRQRTRRSDLTVHVAPIERADWQWESLSSGFRLPVTTRVRTIVDLLLAGEEIDYLHKAMRQTFDDPSEGRAALLHTLARRRKPNAKQRRWAERVIIDQLAEPP